MVKEGKTNNEQRIKASYRKKDLDKIRGYQYVHDPERGPENKK